MKSVLFLVIFYYGGYPMSIDYKRGGSEAWKACNRTSAYLAKVNGAFQLACIKVPQH